jgi:hypothetical protein
MDAAPATEPPPLSTVDAAAGAASPSDEAPPAQPAPEPPTVDVYGKKVLVSDLVRHFDPACRNRCDEGVRKVGRPAPRGFKGVFFVRELCPCTVTGYLAEHPPAPEDLPPPVVGAAARAALEGKAPAPKGDHAIAKARRLREELADERAALECIRAPLREESEAIAAAAKAIDEEAKRAGAEVCAAYDALAAARDRVSNADEWLARVGVARSENAARERRYIEKNAGAIVHQEHLAKRVEKVERRLALVVARHPEAAVE